MHFSFKEWQDIRHDLTVAQREYEHQAEDSHPSDDPMSLYQIFKRQVERTAALIDKIDSALL